MQQLEEAKKTLEGELQVIHSQLEKDGYSSLAQMRCRNSRCLRLRRAYTATLHTSTARGRCGVEDGLR